MTDVIDLCRETLGEANFSTRRVEMMPDRSVDVLAFESDTVLGFILAYDRFEVLAASWRTDIEGLFSSHRFGLRHAGDKAWNAYAVILSRVAAVDQEVTALGSIEEDLIGFRKITYAGISDATDVRNALLPLLPLQSAPKLEAVDMSAEIRVRTQELPSRVVDGFLAAADESVMLQVMEEAS
jgi:hypothetical protein